MKTPTNQTNPGLNPLTPFNHLAEDLLRAHPDPEPVVQRLLEEGKIDRPAAKFLRAFIRYGYYSPFSTGGYGMAASLRGVVETHFQVS